MARTDEERRAYNARVRKAHTPEARAEAMKKAAVAVKEEDARLRAEGLIDAEGNLTEKGRARVEAALAASKGTASSSFTGN